MKNRINNFRTALDYIDATMELERTSIFNGESGVINFRRDKKRSRRYPSKKKRDIKQKHVHANKQLGIISMETFLKNYLGVDGEALKQLKNISHDDLLKMGFEEVKRVPFELVDGYGSQFFYVMDSNGMKIGYYNPAEKLKIENNKQSDSLENDDKDYIIYINRNTKDTEKYSDGEYEEIVEYSQDDLENDLNEVYNDTGIGEKKYGKHKRK